MENNRRNGPSVAIIGAGVIGLSTAFHLLERGHATVTVIEREGIAAGASGVQPGGVRQQWSTALSCRIARTSYQFYREFATNVPSTIEAHLDPCGYLFVADNKATRSELERNLAIQRECGIPSRLLTPADACSLVPALNPDAFIAASYCAEDGYFDRPQSVVEAFAQAAINRGATLVSANVQTLMHVGAGWRLTAGPEDLGPFDRVVVAAGYDSPAITATVGVELPITKRPRYLFFSEPIRERLLEPLVVALDRHIAVKQLANGRVLASDLTAGESPQRIERDWRRQIREQIVELLPLLEYVDLPILVEGFYDMTPDAQPIIDRIDERGLWLAAGFSGHGFMIAPAIGDLIATGILDDGIPESIADFGLARFQDHKPRKNDNVERRVI